MSSPVERPPFPPSETFDILPQIYDLITRLPSASLPPPTTATDTTTNNLSSTIFATAPQWSTTDPLDPKDLLQAAIPIKLKIQRARAVVSALPDVERTIEEQEVEVAELEGRIAKLRGVVAELGRRAGEGAVKMGGDNLESGAIKGAQREGN